MANYHPGGYGPYAGYGAALGGLGQHVYAGAGTGRQTMGMPMGRASGSRGHGRGGGGGQRAPPAKSFDVILLPVELWVAVMKMCRVEEILRLELTCRRLYTVSRTERSLWLLCLQSLDYDHAPDVPPHVAARLHEMSSDGVRALVVRAVHRFHHWAATNSRWSAGDCARETRLQLIPSWSTGRCTPEHRVSFRVQLTAGGQQLVVNNHGTLEVASTGTRRGDVKTPELPRSGSGSDLAGAGSLDDGPRRLWRDPGHMAGDDILGFGHDVVDEGAGIVIAAVTLRHWHHLARRPGRLWLRVTYYNASDNRSSLLSEVLLPDSPNIPTLNVFSTFEVTVHENLIAVSALPGPVSSVYLQNWRSKQSVILSIPSGQHFAYHVYTVRIASNHLFLGLQTPGNCASIAALPFHLFSSHWRPNADRASWLRYPFTPAEAHITPPARDSEVSSVVSLRAYRPTWEDAVARGKGKGRNGGVAGNGPVIVTALIAKSTCLHNPQDLWTLRYIFRSDAFGTGGSTSSASGVGRIHVGPFELVSERMCIEASSAPTPSSGAASASPPSHYSASGSHTSFPEIQPVVGPSNHGCFVISREPIRLCHAENKSGEIVVPPEDVPGMRAPRGTSIEPWSGAVVFWEPGFVVVRYY